MSNFEIYIDISLTLELQYKPNSSTNKRGIIQRAGCQLPGERFNVSIESQVPRSLDPWIRNYWKLRVNVNR